MSDPIIKTCPACGARMRFTHSRAKSASLVVKRRECKACHHVDNLLLRQEIVAIEKVASRVCNHTTADLPSPPPRQ